MSGLTARVLAAGITLAALVSAAPPAAAGDAELQFESCNILYESRDYGQAVSCYQNLLDDGAHNGVLHANLANALQHEARYGEAIYHYRQGQLFLPRNSELRGNLERARHAAGVSERKVPRSTAAQALFFYDSLSPGELWWITALLNVVLWTLLTIRLFRSGEILNWSIAAIALATVVFSATAVLRHLELITEPNAVVLSGTATARSGRDRTAAPMFTLPEGVEVRALARQDGWIEVELPEGLRGWVASTGLGLIEYRATRSVRSVNEAPRNGTGAPLATDEAPPGSG